ncbi:MAG: CvpA family protein [Kiloniellales bacterium]
MADWPINAADLAVFGIILISALFAFLRGLIRELFSVAAWVGAAFAAIYGLPYLQPVLLVIVRQDLIATTLSATVIFVVTLVFGSVVGHVIVGRVKDSMLSALDRSLGFLFGVARGGVLVCLAFLVLTFVVPPDDHPRVLRQAKTIGFIETGADVLRRLLPDSARVESTAKADDARRRVGQATRAQSAFEALMDARPNPSRGPSDSTSPGAGSGYNSGQRKDMDRLFQSTQ